MDTKRTKTPRRMEFQPVQPDGFDVTVRSIVGRVSYDDLSEHSAYQSAFLLIAEQGSEGVYEFPAEDCGQVTVTVAYERSFSRPLMAWMQRNG